MIINGQPLQHEDRLEQPDGSFVVIRDPDFEEENSNTVFRIFKLDGVVSTIYAPYIPKLPIK
jgi:hypothetical protein